MTGISSDMKLLLMSTCNGVQQQFHVRWCSCHCLRVMVSNNTFMSDDVPVICLRVMVDKWQEYHLTWNCCWTALHVDKWQEHRLAWSCCWTQQQFHVRWCSCHLSTFNGFQQQFHVRWCSCHLSTCNGVQQQLHVRWCSCHCLRIWHEAVVGHHYT
jgi:hypothetical protein